MSSRLGPDVAVLVIGPTIAGGSEAIGCGGTVLRFHPCRGDGWAGAGWIVRLARPIVWTTGADDEACFPATSLMPLDGTQAECETTVDIVRELTHA